MRERDVTVPFVDLSAQHAALGDELRAALEHVVESGSFILGPAVAEFEAAFADYCGCRFAVGVASGLDALRLTLAALGIGSGDEVIVPANTYIATALAVSAVGARPVLVDCDATYAVDPARVEEAIGERTRALIPVHLAGQPAEMRALREVADAHGLYVIEDAAQAHGARFRGRRCGSLGVAGCFSFYPSKNLGALGDGGAVTTDDVVLAARLRLLRNYGQTQKYVHSERGGSSRLDTLHAAALLMKLRYLDAWNETRAEIAARYRAALAGVGDIRFQSLRDGSTHVYHLFMIETDDRGRLQRHLREDGIETGIHYPIPIHRQDAYTDLGYDVGDFPVAERVARTALSLPMYPELSPGQVAFVCESIRAFFARRAEHAPRDHAGVVS